MRERTIRYAFDKISGETLDSNEIFKNKPEGFEIRKDNAIERYELTCLECDQKLTVSSSKYDRLHFKHLPNHNYCSLSELDLTPDDIDKFNKALIAKESDRHKELKNKIAERLSNVEGVNIESITIDNRFIIKGHDKRRPDVYCKYYNKEIVFEIQLSELSLRYILSRTEFYKKYGIFLIWILDNFDQEKHSFKRDIKYLSECENFFKLDESADEFKLLCDYKQAFLTKENRLLCKWTSKSLYLTDVKFDYENFQIYYYNYGREWNGLELKQKQIAEKQREVERKEQEKRKYEQALQTANQIISEIYERKSKNYPFVRIEEKISELDEFELSVLNKRIDLKNRKRDGKPLLSYWIDDNAEYAFLDFILSCPDIELDVNLRDSNGVSAFSRLLNLSTGLMVGLFKRGYRLTDEDRITIKSVFPKYSETKLTLYELANKLRCREYVDSIFNHPNIFLTIQSAKLNQITGFGYPSNAWVAFANNAAEHYKEYWEYLELAFKTYGIWETLIQYDKKKTFQKKLQKLYSDNPTQKYDCDGAIKELFPEIFI